MPIIGYEAALELVRAIVKRAPRDNPRFEGKPRAPTPKFGDISDQIATTQFVVDAIDAAIQTEIMELIEFKINQAAEQLIDRQIRAALEEIGGAEYTIVKPPDVVDIDPVVTVSGGTGGIKLGVAEHNELKPPDVTVDEPIITVSGGTSTGGVKLGVAEHNELKPADYIDSDTIIETSIGGDNKPNRVGLAEHNQLQAATDADQDQVDIVELPRKVGAAYHKELTTSD